MANDIDMWNDIEQLERLIKKAKTKKDKVFWKTELKKVLTEFNKRYIYN